MPGTLPNRWVRVFARLAWSLNLAANAVILVFLFPRDPADIIYTYTIQIAYQAVQGFLSLREFGWFVVGLDLLVLAAFLVLALVLAWRKPDDGMALFSSALIMGVGVQFAAVTFSESPYQGLAGYAWLESLQFYLFILTFVGLALLIFIFPDGRFIPRAAGRAIVSFLMIGIPGTIILRGYLGDDFYYVGIAFLSILILGGISSQVYRYKTHATLLQRQQIKWVVVGLSAWPMVSILFGILLADFIPPAITPLYDFLQFLGVYLALLLIPVTLTVSILRQRLWDIDFIIRRTLVYSALSLILGLIYFSGITLLQSAFQSVSGQQSAIGIVISTLAIAALFNPLRRRIQGAIDRRFYRKKYNAEQILARFASAARDETDLEQLSTELLAVVQETMQPESVSLWLKSQKGGRNKKQL